MKNDVIQICGPYPEGFTKDAISSDPNYVFVNDQNFAAVKVWDIDDNSIFVNSFIECEHYVTGGWNYIPKQNSEYLLQNQIGVFLVIAFVTYLFIKRKKKLKYD